MAEIKDRVGTLERTLARLTGGALVAGVALLAFFGVAHFYQIPKEAAKAIPKAIQGYLDDNFGTIQLELDGALAEAKSVSAKATEYADRGEHQISQLEVMLKKYTDRAEHQVSQLEVLLDELSMSSKLTLLRGGLPIGSITMFSGSPDDLPENWRICNGQKISDKESPFNGENLPDLRGMFVRGAENQLMVGTTAGRDKRDRHQHSFNASLNIPRKSLNDGYLSRRIVGGWNVPGRINWSKKKNAIVAGRNDEEKIKDSHGHTGSVTGQTSWNQLSDLENRPRHINLHYIVRIK